MTQKKEQEEKQKSHHEKLLQEIFLIWRHGYTEGHSQKHYDFRNKADKDRLYQGVFVEVVEAIDKLFKEKDDSKKAQTNSI